MNEALRQFAMGVAGVRLWYAREPLPGAAPSPDFDFGEPEGPADGVEILKEAPAAPTPEPASEASRQGLARLQGLMADAATSPSSRVGQPRAADSTPASGQGADVVEPAAPRELESSAEAPAAVETPAGADADALSGQAIAFHWRFWVSEQWLLVSRCPDNASRALEDRLAANILKALGEQVESREDIRWPVFSNTAVPGNDAAGAAEVVSAMADEVRRPQQLWLGLMPEESDPATTKVWAGLYAPLGEASVSFPLSLAALSSDPDGKRRLWQALQQVRRPQ